jgi:hypothetical protein
MAQSPPLTGLAPGAHTVSAVYSGDTDYTGSSSSLAENVTCSLTITETVKGPLSVTGSTCIDDATVKGQVSIAAGGALALSGATVNGPIVANHPAGLLICGSQTAAITVVGSSGPVNMGGTDGSSCGADRVKGALSITDAVGPVTIAGTTATGAITLSGNTGGVSLVDSAAHNVSVVSDAGVTLTADTVTGNLELLFATGTATLDGSRVAGTVKVLSNDASGGLSVEGDTIGRNLACSLNTPAPVDPGPANTVSGKATGQCAKLN